MKELTKITQEELNKLLDKHEEWLTKGNLCYCNLYYYDLSNLDFSNRNLRYIDLYNSDLTNANFANTNLAFVVFRRSNLTNTNFTNATLECADFTNANFTNANFTNADLTNAYLENTIITSTTNFTNAKGVEQICPLEGEFVGYKKCEGNRIVELIIPADALRSNGNHSNKCRCSKAKVLSITNIDGSKEYDMAKSMYNSNFIYQVGDTVEVKNFDTNRFHECTHGIHFFMIRKEAVKYEM